MQNKPIDINLRFVDENELFQQNGVTSKFETTVNSVHVQLSYKFKGEPNYGRIQLELTGHIGEKSLIDDYRMNRNIELPYQYPRLFDLANQTGELVAVPHNQGVYLLPTSCDKTHLIKYQTGNFKTCFFVNELFVLVEDKGYKIVNISDFTEQFVLFKKEKRLLINAVKVQGENIYAVVADLDSNRNKLFVFDRLNLSDNNFKEYNFADLIVDEGLVKKLRYEKQSKLGWISDFKYPSLIDSWRFAPNNIWNSLIGRIEYWEQPKKDGEYFFRTEKYDFIELEIKNGW